MNAGSGPAGSPVNNGMLINKMIEKEKVKRIIEKWNKCKIK